MLRRLEEDNAFFQVLIDTVPPKFYFDQEVQEKLEIEKHASTQLKLKGLNRYSKGVSTKTKHEIARFDPKQQKTVSQIQNEMVETKVKKNKGFHSSSLNRAANLEELQQRLQEKIKDLQSKRNALSFKDKKIEKSRLKQKMKKLKAKERKQANKVINNIKTGKSDNSSNLKATSKAKPHPVFNKEGNILYSKFDFTDSGVSEKKGEFSGKNYKKLLQKIDKEKHKITNIESKDPDKAKDIKEKNVWKKALSKTEGIKVKDDPDLIKKSMKKQEQRKNRSHKKWEARKEHTKKMMDAKQQKRKENINARKKDKLMKKIKKAKKKGRLIPGF